MLTLLRFITKHILLKEIDTHCIQFGLLLAKKATFYLTHVTCSISVVIKFIIFTILVSGCTRSYIRSTLVEESPKEIDFGSISFKNQIFLGTKVMIHWIR